ncbi:hypothetical protein A3C34_03065 [Candidatus Amesbacteria bacterium RIFCSPHIGHO2_02_FULL_48_21]|uniref:ATP synthase subunit delta n=4 Tax=Candidatus Amesiibacteriota TaxID=1752730 RepID=A0A1F4Z447_9BACT|nr:MAG: hypothetical protein UX78_C0017G0009 [Candidatus Amesbacteria bacterium GW2011_GWA2_47_11]KKU92559.1 MAG: hypothetical protein UY22_C0033G0009 [Candidatus Amesbacteria bacterium GW2011_GWC1_48_10]OGC97569.1 MAG: hypothetical protein A3C34_03065 [Candidatus Amesbacteria bacterium RIFCSPHIGHO2_02_FULL_48_21]OGD01079.1 MAG: hypothetical protein A3E17_01035 [Candidatus Amesbacteria bacterium RIFCSPHIGHO2_12_FULL_48_14]OGD02599.1 MAG: hypothetical protein A2354_03600 [Candidatus Amesbacteria
MSSELWDVIKTKNDLEAAKEQLELLENGLYRRGAGGFERVLESRVREEFAEIIKRKIKKVNNAGINERNIIIHEIKKELTKAKMISITVGIDLPISVINMLHEWIMERMGEGIVINVIKEIDVIAGAKIEYEGRYGDYSWKKLLEAFNWKEIIGNRV